MPANAATLKANLENPARIYLWEMLFDPAFSSTLHEQVSVRCQTASIPGRSNGEIHLNYKGSEGLHVPGRLRFPGTMDFTIYEGEDAVVLRYLNEWQEQMQSQAAGTASKDNVLKKALILRLLGKNTEAFKSIKLWGAWPTNRPDVPLNYSTDEILSYSVTFQYDYWTILA